MSAADKTPVKLAGLLVRCRPERLAEVRETLVGMAGVEVHQQDPQGLLVVTAEGLPGERSLITRIESVGNVAGVVSSSLVYSHDDEVLIAEAQENSK